jgi:hypothetical protein
MSISSRDVSKFVRAALIVACPTFAFIRHCRSYGHQWSTDEHGIMQPGQWRCV